MKKVGIPTTQGVATPKFVEAVRQNIEVLAGKRGDNVDLAGLRAMTVSDPPTQEEVDFIRRQLIVLVARIEG